MKDQLFAWQGEPVPATWRLEYRFLHQALIRELMSRIGQGARDNAIFWKYGLWLWDGERRSQLLVRQGDLEREGEPGAGYLEVQAQGERPVEVLREVRAILKGIRVGEEPVETLTLGGKEESLTVLERDAERIRFVKSWGSRRRA